MKKETNIIESVEFLAEEDLLVAELDKRLSYTALAETSKGAACLGVSLCSCLVYACSCVSYVPVPNGAPNASAVRG